MSRNQPATKQSTARVALGWLAWVAVLGAVAIGGGALDRGPLAPPALTQPSSWAEWMRDRTTLEAAFAVLALAVVVLAWYLLGVTSLAVVARLWGARRLVSVVEVLTLPVLRHSLHAALGLSLVGPSLAGGAAAVASASAPTVTIAASPVAAVGGAEPDGAEPAWAEPGESADESAARADDQGDGGDPPVMRLLPEEAPGRPEGLANAPASPTSERTETEWEVRPGDHLWSVAEAVVHDAGEPAGDAEVARYWRRLIEANAERLADPTNPDLIFPGQILALPVLLPHDARALP